MDKHNRISFRLLTPLGSLCPLPGGLLLWLLAFAHAWYQAGSGEMYKDP